MEKLSVSSYISNGHAFHLYTYDMDVDAPDGTCLIDASSVFSVDRELLSSIPTKIIADFFRYQLLFQKGGWWADLDTVCLTYFDFKSRHVLSSIFDYDNLTGAADRYTIGNHLIKAPRSAEFLFDCLSYVRLRGLDKLESNEIGHKFLSKVLSCYSYRNYAKRESTFAPSRHHEAYEFVRPYGKLRLHKTGYALSLWKEMWVKMGLNCERTYHPESIFEKLKKIYLRM